ncbi:hypothetical protein GCK72_012148 [Caenorhabditis remanei]|uniref:SCP domain-containing protein n=1 Tax=Caenorhabditis remanei TaxID=31234 RepID=A0A6A5GK84_CAERE|nr:hypothetical protein GCK72_012148 [Caenorhabditis remanei]KAF1755698.1 hypothetical protein GCK72_012148 [Caenorhabditis remanei]
MKLLLVFSAILFIWQAPLVTAIPEDVQQIVVDYMNRVRESFAVALPVANMNAIVYNASLEKKISTCTVAEHAGKDHRAIFFKSLNLDKGPDTDGDIDSRRASDIMDQNSRIADIDLTRQFVHPLHAGIGCVILRTPCPFPGQPRNATDKATTMCFFGGPENMKPLEGLKRGKPASQCPNGKSEISDYMCRA